MINQLDIFGRQAISKLEKEILRISIKTYLDLLKKNPSFDKNQLKNYIIQISKEKLEEMRYSNVRKR